MSKKAGVISAQTKEAILKAAENEFYVYGFGGSSLRRISASAGVTTGGLYFFFKNKSDLFETILKTVTEPFTQYIKSHYEAEQRRIDENPVTYDSEDYQVMLKLIDLYFDNQRVWTILLNHLNYPAVEEFLDGFIDYSTEHYVNMVKSYLKNHKKEENLDTYAVHQFVHMQADTMITLVSHDFSKDEMIKHSKIVVDMLRGAFMALLNH